MTMLLCACNVISEYMVFLHLLWKLWSLLNNVALALSTSLYYLRFFALEKFLHVQFAFCANYGYSDGRTLQ